MKRIVRGNVVYHTESPDKKESEYVGPVGPRRGEYYHHFQQALEENQHLKRRITEVECALRWLTTAHRRAVSQCTPRIGRGGGVTGEHVFIQEQRVRDMALQAEVAALEKDLLAVRERNGKLRTANRRLKERYQNLVDPPSTPAEHKPYRQCCSPDQFPSDWDSPSTPHPRAYSSSATP
eukprot:NODE_5330_length_690_cov_19.193448_g4956_i0.p1 GENE.NODE_5330_length_690_cov_19.193448_g4956_i0~~NODE_5330_length_690_cov_19.193448_g4956_i0.p1  ORF type:complete len:195 (+),score=45.20 NODE_5330_length_690_cov_19.193448_g4956_i0:50-586(+)